MRGQPLPSPVLQVGHAEVPGGEAHLQGDHLAVTGALVLGGARVLAAAQAGRLRGSPLPRQVRHQRGLLDVGGHLPHELHWGWGVEGGHIRARQGSCAPMPPPCNPGDALTVGGVLSPLACMGGCGTSPSSTGELAEGGQQERGYPAFPPRGVRQPWIAPGTWTWPRGSHPAPRQTPPSGPWDTSQAGDRRWRLIPVAVAGVGKGRRRSTMGPGRRSGCSPS